MTAALERLRTAVHRDRKAPRTALYHHVYQVNHLRAAYLALNRTAAVGVDGTTWQDYGQHLEANLQALAARLRQGAYRAPPVRRVHLPKPDGGSRALGVPALEDKLVQSVTAQLCSAIWEAEFLGFSYGFRPGRSAHDALDALSVGIERTRVNWVLDADLRGFFDSLSHAWVVTFFQHRIRDQRIVGLIQHWLQAGVLEDGTWNASEAGSPQGGLISPIVANVYLHYVVDVWVQQWRQRHARGDVIVVRYADDIVVGFEHRAEAERFQRELRERVARYVRICAGGAGQPASLPRPICVRTQRGLSTLWTSNSVVYGTDPLLATFYLTPMVCSSQGGSEMRHYHRPPFYIAVPYYIGVLTLYMLLAGCSPSVSQGTEQLPRATTTPASNSDTSHVPLGNADFFLPSQLLCHTTYRSTVTRPIEEQMAIEVTEPSAAFAPETAHYKDLAFHVLYQGNPMEGYGIRLFVTEAGTTEELYAVLYQLGKEDLLTHSYPGGHGFTGLHYAYHPETRAELQFWCTAAA